jgi:serine/threonine protein kinase
MDAVRKIHETRYQPARFCSPSRDITVSFSKEYFLFHGDISPNNIICEERINTKTGKSELGLMLTDLSDIGDLTSLRWTRGWASPETIQFVAQSNYQNLTRNAFLSKYGAKKDAWAMGLILGFLVRGDLVQASVPLPNFRFIVNRLTLRDNSVDESGIAQITQEEVDSEIDPLITQSVPPEKLLWQCIKMFLTVDPDKRPTMAERYIS